MCPHCRQNAPVVYRGVIAYCTACGVQRPPLAGTALNLAGQPSKVGGTVARAFGWVILIMGTLTGFGTLAACGAIVGMSAAAPWILSLPILVASWLVSWGLLKSGKSLEAKGDEAQKATRAQAIFALANTRGGVLTAVDVARALDMPVPNADAVLTALAKESPEHVAVDIAEDGTVLYRFDAAWNAVAGWQRARVDAAPPTRVAGSGRAADEEPLEDEIAPPPAGAARSVR